MMGMAWERDGGGTVSIRWQGLSNTTGRVRWSGTAALETSVWGESTTAARVGAGGKVLSLAELLVFPATLGGTERSALEGYLCKRWGSRLVVDQATAAATGGQKTTCIPRRKRWPAVDSSASGGPSVASLPPSGYIPPVVMGGVTLPMPLYSWVAGDLTGLADGGTVSTWPCRSAWSRASMTFVAESRGGAPLPTFHGGTPGGGQPPYVRLGTGIKSWNVGNVMRFDPVGTYFYHWQTFNAASPGMVMLVVLRLHGSTQVSNPKILTTNGGGGNTFIELTYNSGSITVQNKPKLLTEWGTSFNTWYVVGMMMTGGTLLHLKVNRRARQQVAYGNGFQDQGYDLNALGISAWGNWYDLPNVDYHQVCIWRWVRRGVRAHVLRDHPPREEALSTSLFEGLVEGLCTDLGITGT